MAVAFIVEGETEADIVKHLCKDKRDTKIITFGLTISKSLDLSRIAERVQQHYDALSNRYYPLVFWLDREDRAETPQELTQLVIKELEALKVPTKNIQIYFADTQIESWIAPFVADDCTILADAKPTILKGNNLFQFEGSDCETHIKAIYKKNIGHYHKRKHSVELFLKISLAHLATISPSFNTLYRGLRPLCPELMKASS